MPISLIRLTIFDAASENMRGIVEALIFQAMTESGFSGWIDHFSHKYTVCGKLVENDEV